MVRRSSLENKEDPGDTKPRGLTNTNIISNAGDTSQMITNVSTAEAPAVSPLYRLQPRPSSRTEARSLILSMAKGAAAFSADNDDAVDQCARILAVCLWHDVDGIAFGILVDDLILSDRIRSGVSLPELDIDESDDRGEWIAYYEHQIDWHVDELLTATGYPR